MLADELKIGEQVIIDCSSYGVHSYSFGKVKKITAKRKDIVIETSNNYETTYYNDGSEKGDTFHRQYILKINKETMEAYEKYKRKCTVMHFIKKFDGKDQEMIDKIYEIIK